MHKRECTMALHPKEHFQRTVKQLGLSMPNNCRIASRHSSSCMLA